MGKVTDLEKFVRDDIYSPYKNDLDDAYKRLSTPVPRDLEHAKYHLMNAPEWAGYVFGRLSRIDFYFPEYIKHELVSYIIQRLPSKSLKNKESNT